MIGSKFLLSTVLLLGFEHYHFELSPRKVRSRPTAGQVQTRNTAGPGT